MSADVIALLREGFKLSSYEAKVYFTLLHGEMDAKKISAISKVPLPRIYDTLKSLEEKGFVQFSGKRHRAVSPQIAIEGRIAQFDEEYGHERSRRSTLKNRLVKLLSHLDHRRAESSEDIYVLRGIQPIANKFAEMMTESSDIFLTIRKAMEAKELFKNHLRVIPTVKKKIRALLPANTRLGSEDMELVSSLGIAVRYFDGLLFDMMLADSEQVLIAVPDSTSQEPFHAVGIWIKSRPFAQSLRASLEVLWKKGYSRR